MICLRTVDDVEWWITVFIISKQYEKEQSRLSKKAICHSFYNSLSRILELGIITVQEKGTWFVYLHKERFFNVVM